MKNKISWEWWVICAIIPFLMGCECFPVMKGIVFDKNTKMPMENVLVEFGAEKVTTKQNGYFTITGGGCDSKLKISKTGYQPFVIQIKSKDENLHIIIEAKSEYEDLEKPQYLPNDSSSFLVTRLIQLNSTHFEFGDTLKFYLEKVEK